MEALMACCHESDDSDAVQPASRAQASVRRPGLRSGKSAAEPGEVDKLSGIRIEYRHTHKDAIRTLHSGGYIYRGVETLLDGPSSSSTGSDSGGDPQWFMGPPILSQAPPLSQATSSALAFITMSLSMASPFNPRRTRTSQ